MANRLGQLLRRAGDYASSPRVRVVLEAGHDFWFLDPDLGPEHRLDLALLQAAWKVLRQEIMAKWITKYPGTRPAAWWQYESRGPRLQVRPGPTPRGTELAFGKPTQYVEAMPPADMYETEAEYLRRHGLLGRGERLSLEITNGH